MVSRIIVLMIGLIVYFIGNSKKNLTIKGLAIGFIISLFRFKVPHFIEGFIQGERKVSWVEHLSRKIDSTAS